MERTVMKEVLREFCSNIHMEEVGIAPIGPYLELAQILKDRMDKGQYTEFEENSLAHRIDPKLTMEDVQSVIVCLFPYYVGEKSGANLAKYTYGLDYHKVVKDKLEKVGNFLQSKIPRFSYQAFVDTGPLVDRYMAYLAGLGFYGLNGHIITDKYGSYVVIGYMLTNYPFASDVPLNCTCMQCGKCIQACPGKSILGNFAIDPRQCRSYLTQKKGELTEQELSIVKNGNLVFGCDICQDVCPHNRNIAVTTIEEYKENIIDQLSYDELLSLSNKEFMRKFGNRAFSWRGKKIIVRNFEYIN